MIILHVANLAWWGGINSFIIDFSKVFPEFSHEILFLNDNKEQYECYKTLQTQGIRCYHAPKLTGELIDEINPKIICLHNPPNTIYPEKLKDLKILQKCYVILFHHAVTKLFPHVDLDIFVSDWIADSYKGFEKFIKKSKVVHPCVDEEPYLNIKRSYKMLQNVTVGRIQSNTNAHLGKFSEDVNILKKLKNAEFFLVGDGYEKTNDKRFTFAPMGNMIEYLKKIDIFYIWGGKGHIESWSRVITEAMLSGIPVVVKNNFDGLAEQVRKSKAGFLVETEEEFIDTVQRLINDPKLRKKHGELGREWAKENLTLKNLRENLINEMFQFGVS